MLYVVVPRLFHKDDSVEASQNEYSGKGKVDIHLAVEGEQDEN